MMKRKISRSTFLLGVGGAAALASFRVPAGEAAQSGSRNVLWVVDDDHPQYMMSPMPVTRRKIRDLGIEFTMGSTDVPLCGPARVSVLTGLSVTTHKSDSSGQDSLTSNEGNVDGSVINLPDGLPTSVWAARRRADFVRAHVNSSWFAQYCPSIPHFPYTPTDRSAHLYDGARRRVPSVNEADMSDKPRWMRDLPLVHLAVVQAEYEGKMEELADLDYYGMRPILRALGETGQLANTIIFFTSDNGYLHGEHCMRHKDEPYWESAEVPFFVKGPGVRSGATRKALVNHTDLMPTTCEIGGISSASLDVDGRSMLPYLGADRFSGWR
jgi:N-acetylglucosamine-6-sulfatase